MKTTRIALLTAALAAITGAQATQAETPSATDTEDAAVSVRILNNYQTAVRVYVQDSKGNQHKIGRVVRLGLETFEIPQSLVDAGEAVELIAIPVAVPSGFIIPVGAYPGVTTGTISLQAGQLIDFWLEPDLSSSTASVEL